MLVVVVVAVAIIAIVAGAAYLLLGVPPAPTLDRVEVTVPQSTILQKAQVVATARAVATDGVDQTGNATFAWSASPASAVAITSAGAPSRVNIRGVQAGTVIVSANATWGGVTKAGVVTLTIEVGLDRIQIIASKSQIDQREVLAVTATAVATDEWDQTANASFTWSAAPSSRVDLAPGTDDSAVDVTGIEAGSVTLTATGTWRGITKSGNLTLSIDALRFDVTASDTNPSAGGPIDLTVRVLRGTTVAVGYVGTVNFTSNDPLATLPPDTAFAPSDAGVKTFANVVLRSTGSRSIDARDTIADITGSVTVDVQRPTNAPLASFNRTRHLMTVDVDASGSSDPDLDIATFAWSWGDGRTTAPSASPTASHVYAAPGRYLIVLTVTDTAANQDVDTAQVTVANETVDYTFWDFFNVPYADFWDIRATLYWELPMNAECFNATSIAEGTCVADPGNGVPDVLDYPYAHWYSPGTWANPNYWASIWAPYRMKAVGENVTGYNRSEPVFLPVLDYSESPGALLEFDWRLQYLNKTRGEELGVICATNFVFGNDGYVLESLITLRMDLQESRRLFGVTAATPAQAQTWWGSNTDPDCAVPGTVETALENWFVLLGGASTAVGKYDIANGYEWHYDPFATNVNYTVDPVTGETLLEIRHLAYGTEVLLGRFFYWGNASYEDHYLNSTRASGWWGMESAWFEDLTFSGTLSEDTIDFDLTTVMQYHLQQICTPGPNGIYDRTDDEAVWRWGPMLVDYVDNYGGQHPLSELDRYAGLDYAHCTPGSSVTTYGADLLYDYTPITWDAAAGETWEFRFPVGDVVFYDPVATPSSAIPVLGQFAEIAAPMALDRVLPAGYGDWDPATMTWSLVGPASTGGPEGSPGPDSLVGTPDDTYALEPWPLLDFVPGPAPLLSLQHAATDPAPTANVLRSSGTSPALVGDGGRAASAAGGAVQSDAEGWMRVDALQPRWQILREVIQGRKAFPR